MFPFDAKSLDESIKNYKKYSTDETTSFGRCIHIDDKYIGDIWAYCIDAQNKSGYLSIVIFNKSYWKKGLGSKVIKDFVNILKNKYDLQKLFAYTFTNNVASIKCLQKVGFETVEDFEEDGVWSKKLVQIIK
ncbi:MAG: GNAT family N-acetyltransferase [Bacteriovoracaceae bacterium]|nr:GNAT family N-acetyltransferase [Bacteriovoracaceae bacterium]